MAIRIIRIIRATGIAKTIHMLKAILPLSLCLLFLSACGFHLQSHQQLPKNFDNVYILSDATHSPITSEITLLLKTNNLTIVDSIKQADVIFHIVADSKSSAQIGSNATQETRIYHLIYTLGFSLESPKHKLLYGPKSISSSTTNYVYSGQILGNNQEEAPIYETLRRDTLQKLLLKLSSSDVKDALANPLGAENEADT